VVIACSLDRSLTPSTVRKSAGLRASSSSPKPLLIAQNIELMCIKAVSYKSWVSTTTVSYVGHDSHKCKGDSSIVVSPGLLPAQLDPHPNTQGQDCPGKEQGSRRGKPFTTTRTLIHCWRQVFYDVFCER
jgi:hypothetical protein